MWKILPADIPNDNETVWVRIKYYYNPPFLAVWSEANQDFTSVISSIIYPAWCISRWKSQ